MDFENLDKRIAEKYINVTKHLTLDLYIYNYSHKAQFDNVWDNETEQCRGLIMDGARNIVARPFKKFRNLSQHTDLPVEPFTVTEKMDGSLGILYWEGDQPAIATRGSFSSDQAIRATKILRDKFSSNRCEQIFLKNYTYLFEIILPENRIVVDYGKTEDLVLLSIIRTRDGVELTYPAVKTFAQVVGLSVVKSYDGISDFRTLGENARENSEGYVVRFLSGLRVKIKFDEYVRLHRLLTNVNAKAIWDLLRNGESLTELIERVPDEFFLWVKKTKDGLEKRFSDIERNAKEWYTEFGETNPSAGRKQFAELAMESPYRGILFAMLDGKDYSHIIWKMIRPEAEKPFRMELDA
jgi:RNA ligase